MTFKRSLASEAKWYVYTLQDPQDGTVFYVGKGCGNRVNQHERDALNPKTVCSRKIRKIRDLQSRNLPIWKGFHAYFWDEQAAYDCETDLIEEIGLERLTNVLPGGQKAWERRLQQRRLSRRERRPLHERLAEKSGEMATLYARFSDWFRLGLHESGLQIRVSSSDERLKWNDRITEAFHNSFFPTMWREIRKDRAAFDVFSERIKPHGIFLTAKEA